jgi:superfamily II DNA/RNA helicase
MFGKAAKSSSIGRQKLTPMNDGPLLENFSLSKTGQRRPKVHLRYGRIGDIKNKGTLVSTVIEEHMLKFGYLESYDYFINEIAVKNTMDKAPEENRHKLSELKELIKNVSSEYGVLNLRRVLNPGI